MFTGLYRLIYYFPSIIVHLNIERFVQQKQEQFQHQSRRNYKIYLFVHTNIKFESHLRHF